VANLVNSAYAFERDIAISRMFDNISTAATNKLSITIFSRIDNHVTNATREGNIDFIGIGAYNKVERLGGYKGKSMSP
jgi:hypothetical protein